MTGNFWIGTCAAIALAAPAVKAQNQAARPNSTVTVVGCLQHQEANGSLAGTGLGTSTTPERSAVEANTPEPVGYLLADATPAENAQTPGATATTGTTGTTAKPTTYGLEGDAKTFENAIGHRVEITGTTAPAASSGLGTKPDAASREMRAGIQRLRVSSIRVVAPDCKSDKEN